MTIESISPPSSERYDKQLQPFRDEGWDVQLHSHLMVNELWGEHKERTRSFIVHVPREARSSEKQMHLFLERTADFLKGELARARL